MRPVARVAAAALVGGALLVPVAASAPAQAAGRPGVQVSLDGRDSGESSDAPLFAAPPVVVPGDRVSAVLWVRNGGDEPATVRLSATDGWSSSEAFAEHLLVSAAPRGTRLGVGVALEGAQSCALLFSGPVLGPGEVLPIEIALAFDGSTPGRDGHGARAGLDFVAALRDPAASTADGVDCENGALVPGLPGGPDDAGRGGGADAIASTGFAPVAATMGAAVVLVVGVATILLGRGRREREGGR